MNKGSIATFDLNTFSGAFRDESDRACAVLGAAMLDYRLEMLFRRRLRHSVEELLSPRGELGTFAARIRVAHALAWIDEDVQFDLDRVRDVRNRFAHAWDHTLSFGTQSIADRCRSLRVANVLLEAHEKAASNPHPKLSASVIRGMGSVFEPPRARFEVTVEMLAQLLDQLPSDVSAYSGPSLRDQLWDLGTKPNIVFSGSASVEPESSAGEGA